MKPALHLFSLMFLVFFTACQFIAKTVYNGKRPKTETPVSIQNWLQKQHVPFEKVLAVAAEKYYYAGIHYNYGPMLFNNQGDFVSVGYNYDGKFCPKSVDQFLETLVPGFEKNDDQLSNYMIYSRNNIPDTIYPTLKEIYKFSRDLNGNLPADTFQKKKADYTLVIPFAIFLGNTIQTQRVRLFVNAAKRNTAARINIILLNFDKQEWWGEEWNKKINIVV